MQGGTAGPERYGFEEPSGDEPPAKKKTIKKIEKAPRVEKSPRKKVRFGLKTLDHNNDKDRAEQSLLNKLAKEAKFTAEVTIWGHGEDRLGSRMDRAVEFLKRVADPDDPYTYCDARHAMRPRKSEKGLRKDRKRAKKPTVAKNKKSA